MLRPYCTSWLLGFWVCMITSSRNVISHSRLLFTQYHLEGVLSEGCNLSSICEICLQCSCPSPQPQRGTAAVDEMVTMHKVPTQGLLTTSSGHLLSLPGPTWRSICSDPSQPLLQSCHSTVPSRGEDLCPADLPCSDW